MATDITTFSFTRMLDDRKLVLHSRSVMVTLSHMLEAQAGMAGPGTILIATFQRLSLYERVLRRYRQFAPQIRATYVLGIPDAAPPPLPNIEVIALDATWPLVQEWVVIVTGPTCCAALLARDVEGFQPDQHSRRFHGLWTTSPAIVDTAVADFFTALGLPPPAIQRDSQATQQHAALLQRTIPDRLRQLKRPEE